MLVVLSRGEHPLPEGEPMRRQTKKKLTRAGKNVAGELGVGLLALILVMAIGGLIYGGVMLLLLFGLARSGSDGAKVVLGLVVVCVLVTLIESRPWVLLLPAVAMLIVAAGALLDRREA